MPHVMHASDSDGNGKAKATLRFSEDAAGATISLKLTVDKGGQAGAVKGVGQVIFFDANGKPMFNLKLQETVGAELDGGASSESSKALFMRSSFAQKMVAWALNAEAENNNGVFDTLEEMLKDPVGTATKVFGDMGTDFLTGMGSEEIATSGTGWKIFKR